MLLLFRYRKSPWRIENKSKKWCWCAWVMYFWHDLFSFRYKVLEQALKILVKEEILKEKKELLDAAVMQLLPFMIITNANSKSADWKMAVCLSQSDLCSLHPLLKGWPEGKVFLVINLIRENLWQVRTSSLLNLNTYWRRQAVTIRLSCCNCEWILKKTLWKKVEIVKYVSIPL